MTRDLSLWEVSGREEDSQTDFLTFDHDLVFVGDEVLNRSHILEHNLVAVFSQVLWESLSLFQLVLWRNDLEKVVDLSEFLKVVGKEVHGDPLGNLRQTNLSSAVVIRFVSDGRLSLERHGD